ncbi:MAG: hypothetical protein ACOX66_08375 [Oscillospiraceae bacterium]|jgi:hypothetical protein
MYNDISRRLLKAFAGRWVDRAETDTKRSMRKLAEYGISFSSGSLKTFFTQARDILNDDHSPYYRLAAEFIQTTQKVRITDFGINFGYNGFAKEKKKDTKLVLALDGSDISDAASFHQQLTQWDAHEASVVFLFCDSVQPPVELLDSEFKRWPRRAFFLFTYDAAALGHVWGNNVMLVLDASSPDFARRSAALNTHKMLTGAYHRFNDRNADECISDAFLDAVHEAGVNFLFLLRETDCTDDCRLHVNSFCFAEKRRPKRPLFVSELLGDIDSMNVTNR